MNKSIQNIVHYVGAASSSFIELGSGFSNHLTAQGANPIDCVKMLKVGEKTSSSKSCDKSMVDISRSEAFVPFWDSPRKGNETSPSFSKQLSSLSNRVFCSLNRNNYSDLNCPQSHKRQPYYDSYTQNHKKAEQWLSKKNQVNTDSLRVSDHNLNSHLKPYNARLLQKSKMCQRDASKSEANHSQEVICKKEYNKNDDHCKKWFQDKDRIKCKPDVNNANQDVDKCMDSCNGHTKATHSTENAVTRDTLSKFVKDSQPSVSDNTIEKIHEGNSKLTKQTAQESKDEITDWFEYENKDLKTIPIRIEDIEDRCVTKKALSDEYEKESTHTHPSLHSWFSIDFEADPLKQKPEDLTNKQADISQVDKLQYGGKHIENKTDEHCQRNDSKSSDTQKVNMKLKDNNLSPKTNYETNSDSRESSDNSFVLYVRNIPSSRKSSKPSCKKRRRQRAKKQNSAVEVNSVDHSTSKKAGDLKQKCEDSPIAFILGIDPDSYSSRQPHSFLVSCDINSDSDWSDCDVESDDGPEDNLCNPDEPSMFSFCDNFNPLNLKVTCSLQPSTPSSHLDAINLSWQVNISVDTVALDKKTSDKKVNIIKHQNKQL